MTLLWICKTLTKYSSYQELQLLYHLVKYKFEDEKSTEAQRNKTCACTTSQKKLQEAADSGTLPFMYKPAVARCTH